MPFVLDGSKVYAALGGCPAGTNHTNLLANLGSCGGDRVSVIDAAGLTEISTITVGPGAVSVDASSDSTRVFVADAGNGSIAVVTTASGAVTMLQAPTSQIPFMVRVFP
ncbi:MAG TPA: hypothetical protein VE825_15945 [Terriglobales bacterium]|nr:hypothetical protein [Terriglobales bacterium]